MSDIPPQYTEEELKERCVGVYFTDTSEDLTETWQVVFDRDGTNARLAIVHMCMPCSDDDELDDIMLDDFEDMSVKGITWQTAPYIIGVKKFGAADKQAADKRLKAEYKRENYLARLKNMYECGITDQEKYEDIVDMVQNLSLKEYDAMTQKLVEEEKAIILEEMTEKQAKQKYMEFLLMDSKEETIIQKEDIKGTQLFNTVYKDTNYNL